MATPTRETIPSEAPTTRTIVLVFEPTEVETPELLAEEKEVGRW
jgi:hypothetical protein